MTESRSHWCSLSEQDSHPVNNRLTVPAPQAVASMLLVPSLKWLDKSNDKPQTSDFKLVTLSSFLLLKHYHLLLKSSHPPPPNMQALGRLPRAEKGFYLFLGDERAAFCPRFTTSHLYQFLVVAVTNGHQFSGLKQHKFTVIDLEGTSPKLVSLG